jgi:hypothetical protein
MQDKETYKITIDDGYCAYEYTIPNDGELSIAEIAELVHKFLRSNYPLKGKYVGGSGEVDDKN